MKIIEIYSHLNGLEFLLVRKPELWQEIQSYISDLDKNKSFKNFIKDRVSVEAHLGGIKSAADILYAGHLAAYMNDSIDVGIEVLPMKRLQSQMSLGVSFYESEINNVTRQSRNIPAVPLIIIGIEP